MSLPYPGMNFSAFATLTDTQLDQIVANIEALAAGTGLNANVLNSGDIDWTAATGKVWWEELGRTTLAAPSTTMSLSFAAKKYLRLLIGVVTASSNSFTMRLNGDSATNYASFFSIPGGSSGGSVNQTTWDLNGVIGGGGLVALDIFNPSGSIKAGWSISATGTPSAAAAPTPLFNFNKWIASAQATSLVLTAGSNLSAGSEIIMLGHN